MSNEELEEELKEAVKASRKIMKEIGLYIHIPFCKKKCYYCDFISYSQTENIYKKYVDALLKNIEYYSKKINIKNYKVNTIYIGGGTPSIINSSEIVDIIKYIKEKFDVLEGAEITIEVNPGTVDEKKILDYKSVGINRLSIGCQAVQDSLLKMLGRIHNFDEFINTYKKARKLGFDNINVDLMIGLPNQTIDDVKLSIDKMILLKPEHISVYSLIVEDGTVIKNKIDEKKLKLPTDELERNMYYEVKNKLEKSGYIHYEISNFAKDGYYSKHNVNCWNQEEYIGFGLASHSYLNGIRFSNIDDLDKYIINIDKNEFENNIIKNEVQTIEDMRKEYMFLGLRKLDGVSISKFEQKFRINPLFYFRFEISRLEEKGLIEVELDNIKLTKKGLDLANIVWEEFV